MEWPADLLYLQIYYCFRHYIAIAQIRSTLFAKLGANWYIAVFKFDIIRRSSNSSTMPFMDSLCILAVTVRERRSHYWQREQKRFIWRFPYSSKCLHLLPNLCDKYQKRCLSKDLRTQVSSFLYFCIMTHLYWRFIDIY